ncbi:MAG: D-lyxose/D-mannose family sugar isomerase [bacterium]|jgi:D-lyxose ketol-isomerase
MKRSEINAIMKDGLAFLKRMNFLMPPFTHWSPADWKRKGPECRDIIDQQLGWDITDFGSGDFAKVGLLLFTIRNGKFSDLTRPNGKIYAEKIMIVRENQLTPTHFHSQKMEDIINRGGGNLVIRMWNSTPGAKLAQTLVTVAMDGVLVRVKAGGTITLKPGESVCLPQRLFHRFWGQAGKGMVLVGEVSRVNDDHADNTFYDPVGRFPEIEEDVAPLHLLYNDYANYYRCIAKPGDTP